MFNQRVIEYYSDTVERLANLSISVCGAGALGSHIIDNLVRHGARNIFVVDFDRVEEHNIGTQIYDKRDIGHFKIIALQKRCMFISGIHLKTSQKTLVEENVHRLLRGSDLVINTFDNSSSRRIVHEFCLREGIECLNTGMNVNYSGIRWSNENYVVPEDDDGLDACDYPLALNLVHITSAIVSEIILNWIEAENKIDKVVLLRELSIINP